MKLFKKKNLSCKKNNRRYSDYSKLTGYSDEHFDGVSVSVKTELGMGHTAIGYEASRCDTSFRRKDPDSDARCVAFITGGLDSGHRH